MLKDKLTLFSDDQAITASAASTDYMDQLAAGNAVGREVTLDVRVKEAFTASGSATLVIAFQTDDNTGFSSAKTLYTTIAIGKADLVVGYKIRVKMPIGAERYLRMYYTVATGPMTAGKVDAALVDASDVTIED